MWNILVALMCLIFKNVNSDDFKRVCYYTTWSNHLQITSARFQVSDIDPFLCTHAIFAFAKVNTDKLRLEKLEYDDDNGQLGSQAVGKFYEFTKLKIKNPKLVTLLSIGGQSMSESLHIVTEMPEDRLLFAKNCRIFLRDRKFDGLDIDWEYPDVYKDKFTELLKAMRAEFDKDAKNSNKPRLILSIAGAAGKDNINKSYNVPEIVKYIDFINVMAYDYNGPWSQITGFTGPLFSRHSDARFNPELSQNWTMHYWIQKGAPRDMLVMGTTATATSFSLNDNNKNSVGAPVLFSGNGTVKGDPGPMRLMAGHLAYYEVCLKMYENSATKKWDEEQKTNYAYYGNQWIGYNDPKSLKEKVKYAKNMGLGGVMFWTYDLDDFSGKYCGQGKYPLLSAIASAASNNTQSSLTSLQQLNSDGTEQTHTDADNLLGNFTTEASKSSISTISDSTSQKSTKKPTTNRPAFVLYNINGTNNNRHVDYKLFVVTLLSIFILL